MNIHQVRNSIFQISSEQEFNEISLQIFHFQVANNFVYHDFVRHLGIDVSSINHFSQIPFLPIGFFKTHKVSCNPDNIMHTFHSSGTSGMQVSKHHISNLAIYEESFTRAFKIFYGDPKQYQVIALLPSYLERNNSSLVYMADKLISLSRHNNSGFYLNQSQKLPGLLNNPTQRTILLGVTFALLDLAEEHTLTNPGLIIMETGGMKGRRKEIIREELHELLKRKFSIPAIHSEYGMTELLSQAYSPGNGIFQTPPWMKILIRDTNDPLTIIGQNKSGGINVIDLANIYSCSFIATQDLGRINSKGEFEVLGRFDTSDIRGCNLMIR
ncbi:MAG: acyltransferase [Bacteroidales bacterium]|nr:acyltransferase [Bacteroidales bacterium]